MSGRFDLWPLLEGVGAGLRKRRHQGDEPVDRKTRTVLLGVPLVAAVVAISFRTVLSSADQLLAGVALFSGALLTAFAQIASWRERVLDRARGVDGVKLRALDEAAAQILFCVLVAMVATASMAVLANLEITDNSPAAVIIIARALSALGIALFTYLVLAMTIVVNLLWDAYEAVGGPRTNLRSVPEKPDPKRRSADG